MFHVGCKGRMQDRRRVHAWRIGYGATTMIAQVSGKLYKKGNFHPGKTKLKCIEFSRKNLGVVFVV